MSLNQEKPPKKLLKVALVHPKYRPDGGAEKILDDIIEVLQQNEVEINLITRQWGKHTDNIKTIKCSTIYMGRLWRDWGFYWSAKKKLAKLNVDIIHSHVHLPNCNVYYATGGVHSEWLVQKNKISNPLKRLATQTSLFHNLKKYLEKYTFFNQNLDAVICISEMVKKDISKHFNVPPRKLHTIYPGVNFKIFNTEYQPELRRKTRNELNISDDHTVFIFVGSGFERKGLTILIDSLAELPENCELLVIGKDKNLKGYKKRARKLNISERVHFLGMQKEVKRFYAASDVFVLPSLYDAFALVIVEAMACGLPVIASSKCGAAYDFIENGQNGFVFDPLDKNRLVQYMLKLRDPKLREQISANAMNVIPNCDLDTMSQNFMKLYQQLLEDKLKRRNSRFPD